MTEFKSGDIIRIINNQTNLEHLVGRVGIFECYETGFGYYRHIQCSRIRLLVENREDRCGIPAYMLEKLDPSMDDVQFRLVYGISKDLIKEFIV